MHLPVCCTGVSLCRSPETCLQQHCLCRKQLVRLPELLRAHQPNSGLLLPIIPLIHCWTLLIDDLPLNISAVDESVLRTAADKLIALGLADAGYKYLNIDGRTRSSMSVVLPAGTVVWHASRCRSCLLAWLKA